MGKININPDLSKIKQKALDVKNIGAEKTKAIISKVKKARENESVGDDRPLGKRYHKIGVKLLAAYCVPVILIILLGFFSYRTASKVIEEKYLTSVESAIAATGNYMSMICSRSRRASIFPALCTRFVMKDLRSTLSSLENS